MDIQEIVAEISRQIKEEESKPLKVSIMGQTGVGKSSLLNAIFGTNLKTDAVKPCTKDIERIIVKGDDGAELWFYDLPGIGESEVADRNYFEFYIKMLTESDVVLWAIHADNRSTSFDSNALQNLLSQMDENMKVEILSKITFVLTKVDLLSTPAWIFGRINSNVGDFTPNPHIENILQKKKEFYQETFIIPYINRIISTTFNDCNFTLVEDGFSYDKYTIMYKGLIDRDKLVYLAQKYSQYQNVFLRLHRNYEVVPCSALFKYNLAQLMVVITNKLGDSAIRRFKKFTNHNLTLVSVADVKEMCNIVVFDTTTGKTIFNFSNQLL